jgi:dihydrofolate reductase
MRVTVRVSCLACHDSPRAVVPLVVVTHSRPERVPAGRGAPYTFVWAGVERAVDQARALAGGKDVVVMGASIVQQCLSAGILDELIINLVPIFLGGGVRLLEGLATGKSQLRLVRLIDAPGVTHLQYEVERERPVPR